MINIETFILMQNLFQKNLHVKILMEILRCINYGQVENNPIYVHLKYYLL